MATQAWPNPNRFDVLRQLPYVFLTPRRPHGSAELTL
jgi:hypothetical protein